LLEEQEAAEVAAGSKSCSGGAKEGEGKAKEAHEEARAHPIISLFAPGAAAGEESANRDVYPQNSSIESGMYEILPVGANKDAMIAEIRRISMG